VLGTVVFGESVFAPPSVGTYTTAIGERKILTLSDGSKIELNTNSVLRLSANDQRKAWLDKGEAYFRIVHNAASPFEVVAAGHRVTDLGTAFTVRSEKDWIEVSLLEGRARLSSADANVQEHSTVLIPGDVLVATPTSLSVSKQSERIQKEALGWRRGVLVFDHATLADAVAELNRYNRIKLIVADKTAAERTIGATFPVHDVELFARVTEQVLGLRAKHQDGNIVISQ
jgi:transmembrane sensor